MRFVEVLVRPEKDIFDNEVYRWTMMVSGFIHLCERVDQQLIMRGKNPDDYTFSIIRVSRNIS